MDNTIVPRRRFLATAAAAAATAVGTAGADAQGAFSAPDQQPLTVVDFHNHHVGKAFTPIAGGTAPPAAKAYFDEVNRNLADSAALLSSMERAGIAARVVNTPLEFIQDPDEDAPAGRAERINDQMAALISRNPGRLYGLATVDAHSGDAGAREVVRAVRELGLRGIFVASAKKDLLLDAPQARPTLAAAAELGVPVFAHPITDAQLRQRLGRYARPGTTINRGTVNSATLVALLESGTFDELPRLRVVVTTLAVGGILLTAGFGEGRYRSDAAAMIRRHIYVDTMRLNPVFLRATIDMLGADRVLAGTDWPIYAEHNVPGRLRDALVACGLGPAEQRMIASENALKLLRVA